MVSNSNLLEIISPYPFSRYYGINDEVYRMQRTIEKNINVTKYSTIIRTIHIGPIIAPPEDQFIKEKNLSVKRMAMLQYVCIQISMNI